MAETPAELQAEVEKLERKHAENPEGRFFVPLANAYRKLGRLESAESLLREGLRWHPEYLSAHIVLGRCLADRGAGAEAADEFRYVLSLDPQNLIALRSLGEISLGAGSPEEAERWFRELLEADPMNDEARRALVSLQDAAFAREAAAPAAALPRLDDAVEADEEDALPMLLDEEEESPELVTETIAELYARQGLHGRAAEVYRELIRRRGGDPALERRLAEVERLAAGGAPEAPLRPEPQPELPPPPEAGSEPGPPSEIEPLPEVAPEPLDLELAEQAPEAGLPEPEPGLPDVEAEAEAPAAATFAGDAAGDGGEEDEFLAAFSHEFGDDFADLEPDAEPYPADGGAEALPEIAAGPLPGAATAAAAGPTIAAFLAELAAWRPGAAEPGPLDGTGPAAEASLPWELPGLPEEEAVEEEAPEPPAAAAPRAPGTPAPAAAEDDEDLESFQAWLRSLKR